MTTLLHLDSSANRSGESITRRLTGVFAGLWQADHGSAGYSYRDLAAEPVPPLDTAYCTLGRRVERHGLVPPGQVAALVRSPAEERAWRLTRPLIAELLAAGTVVIGAPMYNYSVSATLKAWIDRVTFPGAFIDPDTGDSLLRRTRIVLIMACGGAYDPGTPRQAMDFQEPYLRAYFSRQGVPERNIRCVRAQLALAGIAPHMEELKPAARASLDAALAEVSVSG